MIIARIRSLFSSRPRFRRPGPFRQQEDEPSMDDGEARKSARDSIEALRPSVGNVLGFGTEIQALIEVGLALLERLEKTRAEEGVKKALFCKIDYVFGMVKGVLDQLCVEQAQYMKKDLSDIKEVLEEIHQFIGQTATFARSMVPLRTAIKSDYSRVFTFDTQLDEAVKNISAHTTDHLKDLAKPPDLCLSKPDKKREGVVRMGAGSFTADMDDTVMSLSRVKSCPSL